MQPQLLAPLQEQLASHKPHVQHTQCKLVASKELMEFASGQQPQPLLQTQQLLPPLQCVDSNNAQILY